MHWPNSVLSRLYEPMPPGLLLVSFLFISIAVLRRIAKVFSNADGIYGMYGKVAALVGVLLGMTAITLVYADESTSWQQGVFSWLFMEMVIASFEWFVRRIGVRPSTKA